MKGLTDIPGIRVGHATDLDALTGCTVVLCEEGAAGGGDIRGSAAGTEEFQVMNPLHVSDRVHAVVLAGGSAFGLEAASGVRSYLERKGVGFVTSAGCVPIVPCAILYDLAIGRPEVRPGREMGELAASAATDGPVVEGAVGADAGASVGKLFGMSRAMKSGLGSATVALSGKLDGVLVSALAAVNAFGDVRDPETSRLVAGARSAADSMNLVGTARELMRGTSGGFTGQNTTLVVVATNARLSKVEATKLAQLAQNGLAGAISPAHTTFDGDLVIALSLGDQEAGVNALGSAAVEAVGQAILRAVCLAPSLGGLPGLAG